MGKWKLYYPPAPNSLTTSENEAKYDKEVYRKTYKILKEPFPGKAGRPHKPMLFDLETDPGEQKDLSGEYRDLAAKMADMLGVWYKKATKEWKEKTRATLVDE
jgi:hypothetical protein